MDAPRFRLKSLEIDPPAGLVTGPGGREMLDRKVMDVLVLMARNAGRVVSRDELLVRLWPDVVVTDHAVNRCICVLRTQLSQAGGDPRYRELIETLRKRGYRLNADIEAVPPGDPAAAPQPARRRTWGIAIGISAALALLAILATGVG